MTQRKTPWILAALALCAAVGGTFHLQGCTMGTEECVCTEEFRTLTAVVVDAAGAPVDSADIRATRNSDGKDLGIRGSNWNPNSPEGTTVIFSDNDRNAFPEGILSMDVTVTATKGGKSGTGTYVFTTDSCGCHVGQASGPDTLVIR